MLAVRTLGKIPADHQHLFRMARGDLFARGHAPTGLGEDREGIPRLAHAISIEMPGLEIGVHLRGRNDDDAHIATWLDAMIAQPLPEHEIVRRVGVHHPEGAWLVATANFLAQRLTIPHSAFPKILRKGDGVAVQIQHEPGEALDLHRNP